MNFYLKKLIRLIAIVILFPLTSSASTNVGGPIRQDTTWSIGGSPYIAIQSVNVNEGVTLTIESGVKLEFSSGHKLFVDGQLLAKGTSVNPIIFTSALSLPDKEDWGGIEFTESAIGGTYSETEEYLSGSIIQYATIEYSTTGIYATDEAPFVLNCKIKDNCFGFTHEGEITKIINSEFKNNIFAFNFPTSKPSDTSIINCVFSNNVTPIYHHSFSLTLEVIGSTFDNTGGIILPPGQAEIEITNCYFNNNQTNKNGGVIFFQSSEWESIAPTLTISGCTFSNNQAGWAGGVIYLETLDSASLTITDSSFIDNISTDSGGAIYFSTAPSNSSLTIMDSTFQGNNASNMGGAIFSSCQSTLISRCNFYNNKSNEGGVIFLPGGYNDKADFSECFFDSNNGCIVFSYADLLEFTDCKFTNNTSTWTTAINAVNCSIIGCEFTNNTSTHIRYSYIDSTYGSIISTKNLEMLNSVINSNSGNCAISLRNGSISRCSIANNSPATGDELGEDAGIIVTSDLIITESNIYGNKDYNIRNLSEKDISATGNYWGTTNELAIIMSIYDKLDDASKGEVLYYPFLNENVILPIVTDMDIGNAIVALKIIAGTPVNGALSADVNGDGKIGMEEIIYILERLSGLRN